MKFSRTRITAFGAIIAATALLATGCAGTATTESPAASPETLDEMTKITVATLPIAPSAAILLGIEQGIFEKHNLDVELSTGQGGAAILPAVAAGQVNFAIGQPLPIILAASKGVDVKIVTNYSASYAEGDDINGVVALDESIESPKDLEGKRVAVNTLKAAGDLTIMEAIALDGGDPDNVEWVEVGFPDMPAQLEAGTIDAGWVPEPFLSRVVASGGHVVTYNYQDTIPGLTTLVGFTSGAYADANPAVVAAFTAALDETTAYADENIDEARAMLPDFLGMPEEAAAGLAMEKFGPELNIDAIEKLAELMVKYEFLESEADIDALILK